MRVTVPIILFIITILMGFISYNYLFFGGATYEFCQYSEIATNILSGRGFTTSSFYPSSLAFFAEQGITIADSGPQTDRFPLFALVISCMQLIFGNADSAAVMANILLHGVWVVLIYIVGLNLCTRRVAAWAAVLWALNPMMLAGFNLNGYPDTLFGIVFLMFNITFMVWLENEDAKRRVKLGITCGLFAGLCYLSRFSFIMMAPVYILYLYFNMRKTDERKSIYTALVVFIISVLPWQIYLWSNLGFSMQPLVLWNLATDTIFKSGLPWVEYRVYSYPEFMSASTLALLLKKWVNYFGQFVKELPHFWFCITIFPFAILGIWKTADSQVRRFVRLYAVVLFWTAFCFSFLRVEHLGFMNGRYYLWFAPALLFSAGSFLESALVKQLKEYKLKILITVLALTLCWWITLVPRFPRHIDHPSGKHVGNWPEVAAMRERVVTGWVVSNIPTQLTRYAGVRTIALPNEPLDIKKINSDYPVEYIFVSSHRVGELRHYPRWNSAISGRDGGGLIYLATRLGYDVVSANETSILLRKKDE